MKKRLFALLMAACMVVSLAACGSSSDSSSDTAEEEAEEEEEEEEEEEAEEEAAEEEEASDEEEAADETADASDSDDVWAGWADIDTSEHVVITYMTTGDAPSGEAQDNLNDMLEQLNAILTEKINAEIEMYFISWTDYLSNYNLTLARMDGTVDLVGSSTDWLDAWPNAKDGAFLELSEEMLATYAPATWASVDADTWEMCTYQGDIYFIPEDNYAQWTNHGYAYRADWAEEAGLDGVHSWEDLTEYFYYVKEAYPDITLWDSDGTHYATMAGGWISSHTDYISIDGINTQAMFGGTKDDLYTVYSPYYTETDLLVEFAELMKEWDELGVWPTDVLNNTAADNESEFRVGLTSVHQHHTQTWTGLASSGNASNTIYQDDEDAAVGFFWFGEETGNLVSLSPTHGVMAVSAASENPERALMVYDLIRNDAECYYLFLYGIEGVSYEVNEDGYRTTPEGYDSDTDNIGGITNFWWGRNDDLEIKSAETDWDVVDALYEEYDAVAIAYPYGKLVVDTDSNGIGSLISNIDEINTNYMTQIAYGKYSGTAEEIIAEYQAALASAGIEDVIAEIQAQMDEVY